MRVLYIAIITLIFVSCTHVPVAEFEVIVNNAHNSSFLLFQDSTYKRIIKEEGKIEKDIGKWKGSFALDSVLVTYVELQNGDILCYSKYKNINDTLVLIEWAIQ